MNPQEQQPDNQPAQPLPNEQFATPWPPSPQSPMAAAPPTSPIGQEPAVEQPLAPAGPRPHSSKVLKTVIIILGTLVVLGALIVAGLNLMAAPKLKHAADDTSLKNDMSIIAGQLNDYYQSKGTYPAAPQFYDGTFKPKGLTRINSSDAVNYQPTPAGCNATNVPCTGFSLQTKLDSGEDYTLKN